MHGCDFGLSTKITAHSSILSFFLPFHCSVVVHVEEKLNMGSLKLKLTGKELKNVEGFTRYRLPDPFYIISKKEGEEL